MARQRVDQPSREAKAKNSLNPRILELFGPKPERAAPTTPFTRLSFVRNYGSRGGYSAWDPRQLDEKQLTALFNDHDLVSGDYSHGAHDIKTAEYCIGCCIGALAAREYATYLQNNWREDECNSTLPEIARDMRHAWDGDDRAHGSAISFWSTFEDLIGGALIESRVKKSKRGGA